MLTIKLTDLIKNKKKRKKVYDPTVILNNNKKNTPNKSIVFSRLKDQKQEANILSILSKGIDLF